MIVAPDILSKIEGQPFSADSPFGCQTPLEITPEALQAVDVAPLPIAERLAVVHKPVDVAPRCDARVAGKGVRADDGATLHALVQERQQRLGFHVRYHLRPHQATSTQDPKDSLLSGSTAPLRALNTLCQANCCARNLPGRSRRPPPRRRRHGKRPGPWPGAPRSGLAGLAFAPGGPPGQSPRHSAPRRTSATVAATPLATTEAAAPWAPTRSGRLHNDSYLAECSSSWRVDIEGTQSSVPCHHSLTGGCFGTIP